MTVPDGPRDSDGSRVEGRKASLAAEAHEGAIYGMYTYAGGDESGGTGTCLITGGRDGKIKTWNAEVNANKCSLQRSF